MSVIASVMAKYTALSFPGTAPPIYFDFAPTKDASGNILLLPWVVLKDRGMRIQYEFEYHPIEVTTIDFEIYEVQLVDADAVAAVIKYNGSPQTQAGFDFGSLTISPQTFKQCERVNEVRDLQPIQTETVQLVHRVTLTYEIETAYEF